MLRQKSVLSGLLHSGLIYAWRLCALGTGQSICIIKQGRGRSSNLGFRTLHAEQQHNTFIGDLMDWTWLGPWYRRLYLAAWDAVVDTFHKSHHMTRATFGQVLQRERPWFKMPKIQWAPEQYYFQPVKSTRFCVYAFEERSSYGTTHASSYFKT